MKKLFSSLIFISAFAASFCLPVYASYVVQNGSVTTIKLADGAVTQIKRASLPVAVSASSGVIFTTSGTFSDVTNLSVSLTTTGRPVVVQMVSASAAAGVLVGSVQCVSSSTSDCAAGILFVLDGSGLARMSSGTSPNGNAGVLSGTVACSDFSYLDTSVTAGAHVYKVQWAVSSGTRVNMDQCKLVAYEL
jgi:hypothetical protein